MSITKILNKVHDREHSTIGKPDFLKKYGEQLVPSIDFSSANSFFSNKELIDYHNNKYNSLRYNRDSRETVFQAEHYFSHIFNKSHCLILDSGMRAITIAINSFLDNVDKIFLSREIYRKTRDYCNYLKEIGAIDEIVVYANDDININSLNDKSLLIVENFSNPHLTITNFDVIESYKRKYDCKIILDSTFSGLLNYKYNFDFIDIELQSLTKYVGGYNDIIAGVIVTNSKHIFTKCWDIRSREGGILDSMTTYLLIRSLRDYDLRTEKQKYNTNKIYNFLQSNKNVDKIFLPGKQNNERQNSLFLKYYFHPGSVISFVSSFDVKFLVARMKGLKAIKIAPSFGSIDSLIEVPSIMSHFGKDDNYFKSINLERNLVRLSIGCEPHDMIINDLEYILDDGS